MAYIGKKPATQGKDAGPALKLDDISSDFNGLTTVFELTVNGTAVDPHINNIQVYLGGVHQIPGSSFSLSGSQIVFTGAPSSSLGFHGNVIGDSRLFIPDNDTVEPASFTANTRTHISGSFISGFNYSGTISGSSTSTASFGRLEVAGNTNLTGDIEFDDVTATGNIISTGANKVISGSITSTGSFGRLQIDSTASFGRVITSTADINGGTIDGITSLTAGGDLDIGAHDLRASTLTADSLTATRVPFAGTDGVLSDDSDLTFATATLSATNLTSTGTIKDFGLVSGSSVSTGSVGRLVVGDNIDLVEDQKIHFEADKLTYVESHASDSLRAVVNNRQMFLLDEDTGNRAVFGNETKVFIGANNNQQPTSELEVDGTISGSTDLYIGDNTTYVSASGGNIFATGNISGSATSTGSFGRLQTQQANALIGGNVVTIGGALTTAGTLTTQNNNVTINAVGAARTLTLNESLTVGDGHDGTITFGAASKTLTIENTSLVNQDLTSDASPTFAGGTISGNLSVGGIFTAQEVHTEFESASVLFTSGSTRFGNDTTDVHRVTGSMDISGSLKLPHGDVTITDTLTSTNIGAFNLTGKLTAGSTEIEGSAFDINGGTIDGITSLTAGGDLDIGAHDFRAATLTADGLTAGRVVFAGTNGVLSDDSDLTFATATLSATNLTSTGTIKNFGLVSGSFVSTGSVGRIQTRTADVGIITGTSLTTTGNISGSVTSTGSFGNVNVLLDLDVDGVTNLDVVNIDGNVTIGNTVVNPASGFADQTGIGLKHSATVPEVNISSDAAGLLVGRTSTGGAGKIAEFRKASNVVFDIDTAGSVSGSATSTGSFGRLHVPGGQIDMGDESSDAKITLRSTNTYEIYSELGSDRKFKIHDLSDGVTRLTIDTAGRVGIGDASPDSPLDVKSSEAANTANFNSTNGATNITLESNGSLIGQMEFSGPGPSQIVTRTSASLALGSNNVKTLYITDDDRVGIGTDSPVEVLHVDGQAIIDDASTLATNAVPTTLFINSQTDSTLGFSTRGNGSGCNTIIGIDDSDGDKFKITNHATDIGGADHFVLSGGYVGIGRSAPTNPLYVQNTTAISGDSQRYPLYVHNNVDDDDSWGIYVRGGNAGQTGNTEYLSCYDNDNTKVGMIHNDGGTFSLVDVSDKRLKKNIRNTDINGIDTINSIKVRDFEYKINNNTVKAQFIAQEIKEVFPQASTGTDGALTEGGKIDPMGVTKEGLVGVLVKAVQELSSQVTELKKEIEELKN